MVEKVTVAVDGGPASDAALAWVIDRARTVNMEVELTSVVGVDLDLPVGDGANFLAPYEQALSQAQAQITAALPNLVVTTKVLHGIAREALILASQHTDLLVIGSNKTSPIVGIMHGTLPLKVAGQSRCTTVVVPFDWKPREGAVVVGWVDDQTAETACEFAVAEASRRHAPVTLVHAWSIPPVAPMDAAAAAVLTETLLSTDRRLLAETAHRLKLTHPDVQINEMLESGSAAVAIVRAAHDASLVVVGSRGRGAVVGFFLGSVSHDVLVNMPAPVAVIPHKREPIDVYPELVDEYL